MNTSPDIIGMEDTNAAGCSIELILRPMLLSLAFDGIRHAAGFHRSFPDKR